MFSYRKFFISIFLTLFIFSSPSLYAEDVTLRIAVIASGTSGNLVFNGIARNIAKDDVFKAALAKKHVKVEWVPISTSSVATLVNENFSNKKIDFAFYGDLPAVIINSSGVNVKLVVPGTVGNNSYLIVPANSPAKSIADLKGKRIALHRGRPWEVTFGKYIAANNLQFKDFTLLNLNPQASAAALAAGGVDGFFSLSDAYLLEEKGVGKIIWSTKQAPLDWRMRAELWGTGDFIEKHPDITQLLATATVRAVHWASKDENRDTYFAEQSPLGLPEKIIRLDTLDPNVSWKNYWSPLFNKDITQHYKDVVAHALDKKLIRKSVDSDKLFEPKFVAGALKELNLENYWSSADKVKPVSSVAGPVK